MGKKERDKGHNYERYIARELKKSGLFPEARRHLEYQDGEANGVDLINTGTLAIQIKCRQTYVPVNTIDEIDDPTRIPIVITKADRKRAMAIIPWSELLKIMKGLDVTHHDPPPF